MDYKNAFGLPYEYPDLFEEHMLYVPKKADPPVLDENYPYVNKKLTFRLARFGILIVSQTIGFILVKLLIGLKSQNRKILKKYKKELKGAVILMVTHDETLSRNYGTTFWTVADGEIRDTTESATDMRTAFSAELQLEGGMCG